MIIPFGTVVAYAADIDPSTYISGRNNFGYIGNNTGWLLCDGKAIMQSVFPELFRTIGYTYGGSDGSFNLPDYRGYFLRGLAVDNSVDKGFDNRMPPTNGTKDGVGSTQAYMVQMHEHEYTDYPGTSANSGDVPSTASIVSPKTVYTKNLYSDSTGNTALTGEETRPVNVYANYIIFAGLPGEDHTFSI